MLLILVGFGVAVGMSDWICSGVLKPLVCRLRPTHEPALDPLHLINGYIGGKYGFCSSHAANTMSVGLLFSLLYDIIAGLMVGAAFAFVVWLVLRRLLLVDGEATRQGGS